MDKASAVSVFICYRRNGGSDLAKDLHDVLVKRSIKVFYDEHIRHGEMTGSFPKRLIREIEQCTHFLVIVSKNAFDQHMPDGDPDWFLIEIETAMSLNKTIIPILMDGISMPSKSKLPTSITAFVNEQAVVASPARFLDDLLQALGIPDEKIQNSKISKFSGIVSFIKSKGGYLFWIIVIGVSILLLLCSVPKAQKEEQSPKGINVSMQFASEEDSIDAIDLTNNAEYTVTGLFHVKLLDLEAKDHLLKSDTEESLQHIQLFDEKNLPDYIYNKNFLISNIEIEKRNSYNICDISYYHDLYWIEAPTESQFVIIEADIENLAFSENTYADCTSAYMIGNGNIKYMGEVLPVTKKDLALCYKNEDLDERLQSVIDLRKLNHYDDLSKSEFKIYYDAQTDIPVSRNSHKHYAFIFLLPKKMDVFNADLRLYLIINGVKCVFSIDNAVF